MKETDKEILKKLDICEDLGIKQGFLPTFFYVYPKEGDKINEK